MALCVCPALVATPAVIATQPKARHAVAHVLHRAADRLETPHAEHSAAPVPICPAVSAAPGGIAAAPALPLSGDPAALATPVPGLASPQAAPDGFIASSFGGPVLGIASGRPGNIGSPPEGGITAIGTTPSTLATPVAAINPVTTADPQAGVPEPESWALLVSGFAVTGLLLRARRRTAA